MVGADPGRGWGPVDLLARGAGDGPVSSQVGTVAATVGGVPIGVGEVDAREAALRSGRFAAALPRAGTREGRQLRRWLTQLLATDRGGAVESAMLGVTPDAAPAEDELLPDASARLDIGSVAAAALADPLARAL